MHVSKKTAYCFILLVLPEIECLSVTRKSVILLLRFNYLVTYDFGLQLCFTYAF